MGALGASVSLRDLGFEIRVGVAGTVVGLAAAALVQYGVGARGVISAALCGVLVLLAAFDLEQRRIPNRIVLPATAAILIAQVAIFPDEAPQWVAATLGAGLLLFLPRLFKRDAIGMGDVKLAMLLGAGLGGEVLIALFIGSLAAVPAAVWILVTRGAEGRGQTIPLGPFLALGGVAGVFLGDLPT